MHEYLKLQYSAYESHVQPLCPSAVSPLSPLTEVLRYSTSNMVMLICNGIMFDFYPGLPHMVLATWTDIVQWLQSKALLAETLVNFTHSLWSWCSLTTNWMFSWRPLPEHLVFMVIRHSLVHRPSPAPVLDHLQYAKTIKKWSQRRPGNEAKYITLEDKE